MSGSSHSSGTYRPDLDGLRAIAVALVVIYHAFAQVLPGGFVGVDIFFVISGYLITGIIASDLHRQNFSIRVFYERRIRRIFPALLLVLLVCFAAGYISNFPDEYYLLGKHILGGGGFFSNVLYWNEAGYFDKAAETKPLLHLWSLAVEEQFYIIWPWVMWLVITRWRASLWPVLCLIAASLATSVYLTKVDLTAAYYSPMSRFWEIMLGAACAMVAARTGTARLGDGARTALAWSGALCLALALWFTHKYRPFPGYWALLPTLSACALIMAGPSASVVNRLLAWRPLVLVGLISYPIYLWHWPLIVWADQELPYVQQDARRALAVGVTLVLAWATYRWVEQPLRHARQNSVTGGLVLAMVALMAVAGAVVLSAGMPWRMDDRLAAISEQRLRQSQWVSVDQPCLQAFKLGVADYRDQQVFCRLSGHVQTASVALLGDSTANALFPGVAGLAEAKGQTVANLGNGSCPPLWGVQGRSAWNGRCSDINAAARDWVLQSPSVHTVVLMLAPWDLGRLDFPGVRDELALPDLPARAQVAERLLVQTIKEIRAAGKRVVLSFDAPNLGIDPAACLDRPLGWARPTCQVPESGLQERQPFLALWQAVAAKLGPDVCVFSQAAVLRQADGRYSPLDHTGQLMLRDSHHLSVHGSAVMARELDAQCNLFRIEAEPLVSSTLRMPVE